MAVTGDDRLSAADEQELITLLARHAVEQVAPDELPLFRPTTQAYFDPRRRSGGVRDSDEMLGFGIDADPAQLFVTPVALEVAKAVVAFMIVEAKSVWKEHAKPRIKALALRLLGMEANAEEKPQPEEPIVFTPEQLTEIHEQAVKTAIRAGMAKDRASLLADAIVGAVAR